MIRDARIEESRLGRNRWGRWFLLAITTGVSGFIGCGSSFSPSFVALLDPTGSSATIDHAPGHVVVAFLNSASVDEDLMNYLRTEGGLDVSDAVANALRPRMRMRVQITFTDGSVQTVEFISGSSQLVDEDFDASTVPDLDENTLDDGVMVCDVASVVVEPGTDIDVFIPVEITSFQQTDVENPQGGTTTTFVQREQFPPQFRALQADDVDEDGNVILQRNISVRDVPSPVLSPRCGSVITFVVSGVLTVPFLPEAGTNDPSFEIGDIPTAASIGGRYEFRVAVR